jgi:hypothetical protein
MASDAGGFAGSFAHEVQAGNQLEVHRIGIALVWIHEATVSVSAENVDRGPRFIASR